MEPLVKELLERHKNDRDLTGLKVQQEVKKLRKKYNRCDENITDFNLLVGLDWSGADLSRFNLEELLLSETFEGLTANFERTNFYRARLKKVWAMNANFTQANLSFCDLSDAILTGSNFLEVNLDSTFLDNSDLSFTNLQNTNLYHTYVRNTDFSYASFKNVNLSEVRIDKATGLEYVDTIEIDKSNIGAAVNVYFFIEKYFKSNGFPQKAGIVYYKRKVLRRKLLPKTHRFFSYLFDLICGYGERPFRVVFWAIIAILTFGILYFLLGGPIGGGISPFWDSFYFSGVTFTTLGFGDLHPGPYNILMKILTTGEAFLGAFLMPLFVVCLSRKLMR